MVLVAALSGVLGLAIGSFLNVVIHRVPAGLSVVRPRSACPTCRSPIRSRDNVPVVSWLALGGRCRDCRTPISIRYPLVETSTGLLFAIVTVWVFRGVVEGLTAPISAVLQIAALLYVAAISVALTMIDLDTHRLPDAVVLPSYPILIVLLAVSSASGGDWGALGRGLIGMVGLASIYLLAAIVVPGGMGMGDVKLAGIIGLVLAYLGWGPLAVGSFAAFQLGGTFAIVLVTLRRTDRKGGIPFGPWMVSGAWVGVFFGTGLWNAYLALIGLA
ncbi:prepilin peptidase [Curtobacterium sp. C1]|uniref:prepilin peptidase n=1 Tax=Curtobacterium sp. C1 TaxID=2898151 RepID=UPI001E425108|nr:A24 family peptidase [Curtobacterium sp. C1]UFU15825.1 prepilin peptidase [Curtobacterium sp. C1]